MWPLETDSRTGPLYRHGQELCRRNPEMVRVSWLSLIARMLIIVTEFDVGEGKGQGGGNR